MCLLPPAGELMLIGSSADEIKDEQNGSYFFLSFLLRDIFSSQVLIYTDESILVWKFRPHFKETFFLAFLSWRKRGVREREREGEDAGSNTTKLWWARKLWKDAPSAYTHQSRVIDDDRRVVLNAYCLTSSVTSMSFSLSLSAHLWGKSHVWRANIVVNVGDVHFVILLGLSFIPVHLSFSPVYFPLFDCPCTI